MDHPAPQLPAGSEPADGPAVEVLEAFGLRGAGDTVSLTGGHIHRTWRVGAVVLQRLGSGIFRDLDALMANRQVVTEALARHVPEWADRTSLRTTDGQLLATCHKGHRWRAHPHVAGIVPTQTASLEMLFAVGAAFGRFLGAMSELQVQLEPTIVDFHAPAGRVAQLRDAAQRDPIGRRTTSEEQLEVVGDLSALLLPLWDPGVLPVRTVHNDAKLANVVFAEGAHPTPLAVLDLDTTMPGSALADVGELVRSSAARSAEHQAAPVELDRVVSVISGYLSAAGHLIEPAERALLGWSGGLLSFENGVRFLTDHLLGDPYFGAEYAGQNLDRARAQLALCEDLVEMEEAISASLDLR